MRAIEDLVDVAKSGAIALGCVSSFVGLEYINREYLNGAMGDLHTGNLAGEYAFLCSQFMLSAGALSTGFIGAGKLCSVFYNLFSGKYLEEINGQVVLE